MKHPVIALKLHSGAIKLYDEISQMRLPDGCIGICFAFESKTAAREFWGKDVPMARIINPHKEE